MSVLSECANGKERSLVKMPLIFVSANAAPPTNRHHRKWIIWQKVSKHKRLKRKVHPCVWCTGGVICRLFCSKPWMNHIVDKVSNSFIQSHVIVNKRAKLISFSADYFIYLPNIYCNHDWHFNRRRLEEIGGKLQ